MTKTLAGILCTARSSKKGWDFTEGGDGGGQILQPRPKGDEKTYHSWRAQGLGAGIKEREVKASPSAGYLTSGKKTTH